jgi:hypothetical protein
MRKTSPAILCTTRTTFLAVRFSTRTTYLAKRMTRRMKNCDERSLSSRYLSCYRDIQRLPKTPFSSVVRKEYFDVLHPNVTRIYYFVNSNINNTSLTVSTVSADAHTEPDNDIVHL